LASSLLLLPLAFSQQHYEITDVGNFGGSNGADANAVNARGEVTGSASLCCETEEPKTHAFYWSKSTGIVDLGTFLDFSWGYGINSSGEVVGNTRWLGVSSDIAGFTWSLNDPMQLLTVASASNLASTFITTAYGINDSGQIVGYKYTSYNVSHAYRLTG